MESQPTIPIDQPTVSTVAPKSKLPGIVLGTVLIILGVILLVKKFTAPYMQRPPFSATPTLESSPLTNWQTYTNEQYEFQFKYPPGLVSQDGNLSGEIAFFGSDEKLDLLLRLLPVSDLPSYLSEQLKSPATEKLISQRKIQSSSGELIDVIEYTGVNDTIYKHAFVKISGTQILDILSYQQRTSFDNFDQIISTFKTFHQTNSVILNSPNSNDLVKSPLTVAGTAPSNWLFEGQLGIKLLDSQRNLIAQAGGQETVPGSWQSDQPVQFTGILTFTTSETSGYLVIEADNPSGLPENSKSYEIPVHFR